MIPLLQVTSVSKRFRHRPALRNLFGRERSGTTLALDDVSFKAGRGEVVAVLGPNGSGKTTLFKIIAGMLLPDSGSVQVAGVRRHQDGSISMAIASERSFFARLTGRENLDYFAALEDIPRSDRRTEIARVLEIVSLSEQADLLVQKFSSGMYQRLAIARALLRKPAVLLLDEPTRSLDPAAVDSLWGWIREEAAAHATVLIATHNFAEAAAVASRALILHAGRVVATQTTSSPENLRTLYFAAAGQPARTRMAAAGTP